LRASQGPLKGVNQGTAVLYPPPAAAVKREPGVQRLPLDHGVGSTMSNNAEFRDVTG